MIVGIRGATTVEKNRREEILNGTEHLLKEIMVQNNLTEDNLISLIFTVTQDLDQAFPAQAARNLGITGTPLMCMVEIPVPNSLPKCIRVLAHCQGDFKKFQVKHVYLKEAVNLRKDLAKND